MQRDNGKSGGLQRDEHYELIYPRMLILRQRVECPNGLHAERPRREQQGPVLPVAREEEKGDAHERERLQQCWRDPHADHAQLPSERVIKASVHKWQDLGRIL